MAKSSKSRADQPRSGKAFSTWLYNQQARASADRIGSRGAAGPAVSLITGEKIVRVGRPRKLASPLVSEPLAPALARKQIADEIIARGERERIDAERRRRRKEKRKAKKLAQRRNK